jgi:hypothetical protein
MIITYESDTDVPVWKMAEVINDKRVRTWWRVRLWTGQIREFRTRPAAIMAYWR